MDLLKTYSRRSFLLIFFFMLLLFILIHVAFYLKIDNISEKVSVLAQANADAGLFEQSESAFEIVTVLKKFIYYGIPISAVIFVISGILLWLFLRSFVRKQVKNLAPASGKKEIKTVSKSKMVNKEKELNDRRLFLHLLSALQKDGRLVDFFSEDLGLYEDSQIGVAVRNIHESCKKVLDKYLEPVAVIDKAEGDEITIPENFDPGAIKLTGNVTGEPPFRGILRHKGWQAKKIDMPTLSSNLDSKIIAPAEVEIVSNAPSES